MRVSKIRFVYGSYLKTMDLAHLENVEKIISMADPKTILSGVYAQEDISIAVLRLVGQLIGEDVCLITSSHGKSKEDCSTSAN